MGDSRVGDGTLPALLPPCPSIRVLSYSNLSRDPLTPADGPGSVSVKSRIKMMVRGIWRYSMPSMVTHKSDGLLSHKNRWKINNDQ